ncbi:hypothetical protein [Chondromyces crocatus]|uniref:Uncharacterized protein n=1 Tax=Chondromyces crocatus TaxID=52 RepID=A0A0K1EM22_CHOCO|nr:hypothetical protein [Chondromyces crocatus]AKT41663.1 uncharacterized protein CMC5_058690 [Chondromyces crocatus]
MWRSSWNDMGALRGVVVAVLLGAPAACVVQSGGPADAQPSEMQAAPEGASPGSENAAQPADVDREPTAPQAGVKRWQPPARNELPSQVDGNNQAPEAERGLVGTWHSSSCGPRAYERVLNLQAGGRFEASDLVSPCPPGVTCVWSGIVGRRGVYVVQGNEIIFRLEGPKPSQGTPFPDKMVIDPETSGPAEQVGSAYCVYKRER